MKPHNNHLRLVTDPTDELQRVAAAEEYAAAKVAAGLAQGAFSEEDVASALAEFTRAYHTQSEVK